MKKVRISEKLEKRMWCVCGQGRPLRIKKKGLSKHRFLQLMATPGEEELPDAYDHGTENAAEVKTTSK